MSSRKKECLIRIKVNGLDLISLKYLPNNKSYILTFPKMATPEGSFVENHLSFHTENNRITNKITNAGDSTTDFEAIKKEAKEKSAYVTQKDIDLLKGLCLDEVDLSKKLVHWGYVSYNFLHDDFLQRVIAKAKTSDGEFQEIIELETSPELPAIYIAFYVSKNLKTNPSLLVSEVARDPIDNQFFITHGQGVDTYTFSILVKLADRFLVKKSS